MSTTQILYICLGDGRTAPIPIIVKQGNLCLFYCVLVCVLKCSSFSFWLQGRVGLGREKFVHEKVKRAAEIKAQRTVWDRRNTQDFHQRTQETFSQRKVSSDLWKSQLACEQLDTKMVSHLDDWRGSSIDRQFYSPATVHSR